jgi:hypothetical protein
MCNQKTLQDTSNVTSLLGLEAGHMPCASPDGRMTGKSGQEAAPANPSPLQENGAVQMTLGISGLPGSDSSESANLQSFLVNRLRVQTVLPGSTLFTVIWKVRVTPLLRSIYALRGRALHTSAKDFTSWRSPQSSDGEGGVMEIRPGTAGKYKLRDEVQLASWATPTVDSAHPRKKKYAQGGTPLTLQAAWAVKNSRPLNEQAVSGLTANGFTAQTGSIEQLNPAFSLWLQGFPEEWLSCAP